MLERFTVLIAARDLLDTLRETLAAEGEVVAFAENEAVRALEMIAERRPAVVALERIFASTPRGSALINRIKSDKALTGTEVIILTHDKHASRTVHRWEAPAPKPAAEQSGTRRAPRIPVRDGIDVLVDGNGARLVDLSLVGAQLLSTVRLKPNTKVRVALADDLLTTRVGGMVVWARFEIPDRTGDPRYRAGIEFMDADPSKIESFCSRWKA